MKPKKITAAMLRQHGACADQVRVFETNWPDGMTPTIAACRKAARLRLDIGWAARNLLSATAWKVYDEAIAPARKVYDEAIATAFAAAWQVESALAAGE